VEATGAAAVGIEVAIAIAVEVIVVVTVAAATAAIALLLSSLLLLRAPKQKYFPNLPQNRSFDAQTLRSIEGAGGRGAAFRITTTFATGPNRCASIKYYRPGVDTASKTFSMRADGSIGA
jgi:hypothetical protein